MGYKKWNTQCKHRKQGKQHLCYLKKTLDISTKRVKKDSLCETCRQGVRIRENEYTGFKWKHT